MDDARVWGSETGLWTATPEHYGEIVSDDCLMGLPEAPFIFKGPDAVEAVSRTPRWDEVEFTLRQVSRPQDGLIVIAYIVKAARGEETYYASCTTTYRRLDHDVWRVIQHQQTPRPAA